MISDEKASVKKIKNLVSAAQKLAAVQYRLGLHPENNKIKDKVNKAWCEFQLATDSVLNSKLIITESRAGIGLDSEPRRK